MPTKRIPCTHCERIKSLFAGVKSISSPSKSNHGIPSSQPASRRDLRPGLRPGGLGGMLHLPGAGGIQDGQRRLRGCACNRKLSQRLRSDDLRRWSCPVGRLLRPGTVQHLRLQLRRRLSERRLVTGICEEEPAVRNPDHQSHQAAILTPCIT